MAAACSGDPRPWRYKQLFIRKREEEQRRREAVRRVSANAADKRRVSLVRAEQEKLASMNINDSLETKKSSKGERTKTKEERHTAHKSRMSRRRSTAERAEAPEALSCDTDASQTTRLDELLSPTVCREPPSLKPTPPTWPRVRDRSSSNTSAPSPPASALEQSEAGAGDCIPLKKRDSRPSRTHASLQKQRNRKERAFVKDQTASLRSSSSLQRQQPSGGAQAGNHSITREQQDGELRRNEAARILQQAWLRFRARRGRELKDRVEVESSDSSYKRKVETRVQLGKPGSKGSVLQNIYGNSVVRRGRSFHSHPDVPSRTQSQLSGLDCVHLTDALNQAKQYSYHLRPHSAGQGARGRGKH